MNNTNFHNHKVFSSMLVKGFNKKISEDEEEDNVGKKKMMVQLMNHGEISEAIQDFVLKENIEKSNPKVNLSYLDEEFGKTRYNNKESLHNFFNKTHKFEELRRKGTLKENTPSICFIASCKKENLVPIATYLVKRDGNENELNLK